MQMDGVVLKLGAAVGVSIVVALGCAEEPILPDQNINVCVSNADCLGDVQLCHPSGMICVPTCENADDCPDTQKNCMGIKDGAGTVLTTAKVCQCSTDALCKGDDDLAEVVCSPVDNICEDKCTTDADCADFTNTERECNAGGACVIKV